MSYHKHHLEGRRFGLLTVSSFAGKVREKDKNNYWNCICECGNTSCVRQDNLLRGQTTSCGCVGEKEFLNRERMQKSGIENHRFLHGLSNTRFNIIWAGMKQRCYNPRAHEYNAYGGRGIRVCDEWRHNLEAFLSLGASKRVSRRPDYRPNR